MQTVVQWNLFFLKRVWKKNKHGMLDLATYINTVQQERGLFFSYVTRSLNIYPIEIYESQKNKAEIEIYLKGKH